VRFLKWFVIVVVVLFGLVWIVGYNLPQSHVASLERVYAARPDEIFPVITTPANYPKWRTGVQRVELLPDSDRVQRFREVALDGEVTYAVDEYVPNTRYVTRIADAGLPYGGRWIFELTPTAGGTSVKITEEGEVYNPVFRFVSKYIMGHTGGIDRYLKDLEKGLSTQQQ